MAPRLDIFVKTGHRQYIYNSIYLKHFETREMSALSVINMLVCLSPRLSYHVNKYILMHHKHNYNKTTYAK